MSIAYPWEIDRFWLATEIVMPVLVWLFAFVIVAILLDIAGRACRRSSERWFERNFGEASHSVIHPDEIPDARKLQKPKPAVTG